MDRPYCLIPAGAPAWAMSLAILGWVSGPGAATADVPYPSGTPTLGARYAPDGKSVRFRVYSSRATKVEVWLYDKPFGADEKARIDLAKDPDSNVWAVTVPVATLEQKGITGTVYYGLRAWGPNWPFSADWSKGSAAGFAQDVDGDGNRFNPNKLLIDPYAPEVSHDPLNRDNLDGTVYASGPDHRLKDSGRVAPKGVVLKPDPTPIGDRPDRPLKDEVIYEVHVRGFTARDPSVPAKEQGTYSGAARKADYLKNLGVTAVEFLPVHEACNDQNDATPGPQGHDYWGYSTLGFFAPDRRYASDKSPGGPTREFRAMTQAFHARGIKVYLDVVYNHTGEGGLYDNKPETVNVLSWRGLDNPAYYELTKDGRFYYDNTGVNGNFNCAERAVRDLILDSLRYWSAVMGVDGFRFDLAPVLGNRLARQQADGEGFIFDKLPGDNPLNRAVKELPGRPAAGGPGVDLIAEPWTASGAGGQQQGNFPAGWAEWNDHFRDAFRKSQNKLGVDAVTPGEMAMRFAGSRDLYQDDGRKPWHSINFLVAHDGPCLRDLYAFNIDGRRAWDQGGDKALQRQAARNAFALPLVSAGVPMFTGGDEMYRTQGGQDNPFDRDDDTTHLDWAGLAANKSHAAFARRAIAFRRAHPALRPAEYFDGNDHNGNGLKDITWYRDNGAEPDNAYWNDPDRHFLAYRVDGTEFADPARSVYVGYNGWKDPVKVTLPQPGPGKAWHRVADTAGWMEPQDNFKEPGSEDRLNDPSYEMKGRSLLILIEK